MQRALASLLQISLSKIDQILVQIKAGNSAPRSSQRGKHDKRPNKISPEQLQAAMEHIGSFPCEMSHYSRTNNTSRVYLSSQLSISMMHRLYKVWAEEQQKVTISARAYRDVFNEKFNYGFGKPRSDACAQCDGIDASEEHELCAEAAFDQQNIDRLMAQKNDDVHYITFDLQKTLPLPRISTGLAFYLHQLWLYNFCIHLISKTKVVATASKECRTGRYPCAGSAQSTIFPSMDGE